MSKLTKAGSTILAVAMLFTVVFCTTFPVSAMNQEDNLNGSSSIYVIAGDEKLCGTPWQPYADKAPNNVMTKKSDGTYEKVFTNVESSGNINTYYEFQIVENQVNGDLLWFANNDKNYEFQVISKCDIIINFNPKTKKVTVTGDGIDDYKNLKVDSITICGNGFESWLNNSVWNPNEKSNHMTEVSSNVYETKYHGVTDINNCEFKFALNDTWYCNWGGDFNGFGVETEAVFNGNNIIFELPYKPIDITVRLDLSKYDHETKTGAKFTILSSIADEKLYEQYINNHEEFIGVENDNNTYHNLLTHCDLSQIALEDYEDLEDTYNLWRAVRGEIFENPYYVVLADMVMGEGTAQGQLESFDANLDNNWLSLTNDVIELINSKVELTPSQESKIKKMFKNKDFSDETIFKLLEDILGSKVSQDELNSIFNAYDKTNTFIDFFNKGANIVNSVVDTINYSAILKSYEDTSDEFKVVLMQIAYSCQMENPWLYSAIDKYLNSDYDTEMRNKIIEEVAKNGLDIGKTLFKDAIVNRVKNFLISNMDLSKVGTKAASGVLAFVQGAEIGKSIGIGIDNILFNTDDVTNSYVTASATAKTAEYLKFVLKNNESALRNNPTIKNACLFCETFNMYKNIQLKVADSMITYFTKNQSALINKIFKSNNVAYENQIYNWQILKLNWQNASCHKGYILKSSMKNITVACPVNIVIYNQSGNIVLKIVNNEVVYNSGEIVATVCNSIKYITLPDDSYNVKITATNDGIMSYSVSDFDIFENMSKTIHFDNIQISKGNEYSGEIISGTEYKQDDIALYSNNEIVDSEISIYTDEDKIEVSNIELNSSLLSLAVGETDTIVATIVPQNASNKSVTWYSENPEIAQVDEYGNITGVSMGITSIVCASLNGNVKSICDVSVNNKYLLGDVNGDGEISIEDVTILQKYLANIVDFDDEQLAVADTNGDGIINIRDATQIQQYLVNIITSLG